MIRAPSNDPDINATDFHEKDLKNTRVIGIITNMGMAVFLLNKANSKYSKVKLSDFHFRESINRNAERRANMENSMLSNSSRFFKLLTTSL